MNFIGEGHQASGKFQGKIVRFYGEEVWKHKGKRFIWLFKIVCPVCQAEGEQLEHKNWYMSKEDNEDLLIECKKCGNLINTDNEKDFNQAKKELSWKELGLF